MDRTFTMFALRALRALGIAVLISLFCLYLDIKILYIKADVKWRYPRRGHVPVTSRM